MKAVLRGKFIAIQSYFRKQEKSQLYNLTQHLTPKEKKEQTRPKVSRKKKITKIRVEIELKKIKAKISKIKGWFFEKISKIYKPVARLIKKKESGLKSIKLKGKKEKLQMTPLKYKGS